MWRSGDTTVSNTFKAPSLHGSFKKYPPPTMAVPTYLMPDLI